MKVSSQVFSPLGYFWRNQFTICIYSELDGWKAFEARWQISNYEYEEPLRLFLLYIFPKLV